jgi:hypothetical protein
MSASDSGWTRWAQVWGVVATVGACLGFLMWGPAQVLWTGLAAAVCAAALETLHRPATSGAAPLAFRRPGRRTAWFALLGAVAVVAARALGEVWPAGLLIALVAAALSTPTVVRWVRQQVRPVEAHPSPAEGPSPSWSGGWAAGNSKPPEVMSEAELCFTWRRSFQALIESTTPAQRQAVVAVRQACLDELERRNPLALSAWLESGPTPAGGPERFLVLGQQDRKDGEAA